MQFVFISNGFEASSECDAPKIITQVQPFSLVTFASSNSYLKKSRVGWTLTKIMTVSRIENGLVKNTKIEICNTVDSWR